MNAKVSDLMVREVVTTVPHKSMGHAKEIMESHKIHSIPVVNTENEPVGIITTSDLLKDSSDGTPVSKLMSEKIYTVPAYQDVSVAARVMRNHKIHHVLVTHEQKLVGLLSSFDLLKLVEDHRFTMKNAPSKNKKAHSHE